MLKYSMLWVAALALIAGCGKTADESGDIPLTTGIEASGTFSPVGPPVEPPTRVDAGGVCIVDLKQAYTITGTLSGSLSIDFRILVDGPCGSPLGTYHERWIAHGTFTGKLDGEDVSSVFSYIGEVADQGGVSGSLVFGPGLEGGLRVSGILSDGRLSYEGRVNRE